MRTRDPQSTPSDAIERPSDEAALAFVRRHQRGVWRFLRASGCPPHAADEVAQDALLVALDKRVDDLAAPAFLRQTAKFLWLRRLRDEGRARERLLEAAEALWREDAERDDGDGVLAALRECLGSLPPRSRTVVERVYRDGCSRAELAQDLGIGEHGARTFLQRLRATLRDCIERRLAR